MSDMKFKFTIQPYQTEAVESVINVFAGQPFNDRFTYRRDARIERDITNWKMSDEPQKMGGTATREGLKEFNLLFCLNYSVTVKHIYFVAETKGTMETLSLKPIEKAKIHCAKKLFEKLSGEDVVYDTVDSYQHLLDIMESR